MLFATGLVHLVVLIPKGNFKTTLMAGVALFHLLVTPNANVYIGAADVEQAKEMYRFAVHFAECDPAIAALVDVRRSTREIRSRRDEGFIRVLASDDSKQAGKKQGFNPTLALIDELHAHENINLYTDLRSGLFKRRGIMATISTAGRDIEGNVLRELRQRFYEEAGEITRNLKADPFGNVTGPYDDGRLTIARMPTGNSVMLEWALAPGDDHTSDAIVKLANPASGVTLDSIADARESLRPSEFLRYRCNIWTIAHETWFPDGSWEKLAKRRMRLDPDLPALGGVDMARYRDCAGVMLAQVIGTDAEGEPIYRFKRWYVRKGSKARPVPYDEVKDAIREACAEYRVLGVGFDPRYFDQAAEELAAEGIPMEEIPQSNERLCPVWAEFRAAIIGGRVEHDGDPTLRAHMYAGKLVEVGDNAFRVKRQSGDGAPPMDLAAASANALYLCQNGPALITDHTELIA